MTAAATFFKQVATSKLSGVELLSVLLTHCLYINDELDTRIYQQGQGSLHFCQKEKKRLICQKARIPICAKVAWHFEIKAHENSRDEY